MAYEISVSSIPVFQEEQYTVSWASEQGDPTPFQLVLVMDKPEESAFALTTEAGGSTGTVVFLAPTQAGYVHDCLGSSIPDSLPVPI